MYERPWNNSTSSGRFFGSGKQAADHHSVCARRNGLGQVTGKTDTAIRNQRHTFILQCIRHIGDGRDLGYADAGHDARGADRTRALPYFDTISTGLDQRQGAFAGGDIAANHLHIGKILLDPADPLQHTAGMPMRGIHNDHINTGARPAP